MPPICKHGNEKTKCTAGCAKQLLRKIMLKETNKPPVLSDSGPNGDEQNRQIIEEIFRDDERCRQMLKDSNGILGMSPFLVVCSVGHEEVVDRMLKMGVNVNIRCPSNGNTALILATKGSHVHVMKKLISHGADLSLVNDEGNNAFMVAILSADVKTVNLLWQYRSHFDINHANRKGYTVLMLSCERNWESCVNMLISGGVDKHMQARDGTTALMLAAVHSDFKCLERLVGAGASILQEDRLGRTAICKAIIGSKKPDDSNASDHSDEAAKFLFSKLSLPLKEDYVKRRIELLFHLPPTNTMTALDYYTQILFVVFRYLIKMDGNKDYFYKFQAVRGLLNLEDKHMEHSSMIEDICGLFCILMWHAELYTEARFAQQFMRYRGAEITLKTINMYSNNGKYDSTIAFFALMPIVFATEIPEGKKWLKKNYYLINSAISQFQEIHAVLEELDDCDVKEKMVTMWDRFKVSFDQIQKEQSNLMCKQLIGESMDDMSPKLKTKKEKRRERRKQKKEQQVGEINGSDSGEEVFELAPSVERKPQYFRESESRKLLEPPINCSKGVAPYEFPHSKELDGADMNVNSNANLTPTGKSSPFKCSLEVVRKHMKSEDHSDPIRFEPVPGVNVMLLYGDKWPSTADSQSVRIDPKTNHRIQISKHIVKPGAEPVVKCSGGTGTIYSEENSNGELVLTLEEDLDSPVEDLRSGTGSVMSKPQLCLLTRERSTNDQSPKPQQKEGTFTRMFGRLTSFFKGEKCPEPYQERDIYPEIDETNALYTMKKVKKMNRLRKKQESEGRVFTNDEQVRVGYSYEPDSFSDFTKVVHKKSSKPMKTSGKSETQQVHQPTIPGQAFSSRTNEKAKGRQKNMLDPKQSQKELVDRAQKQQCAQQNVPRAVKKSSQMKKSDPPATNNTDVEKLKDVREPVQKEEKKECVTNEQRNELKSKETENGSQAEKDNGMEQGPTGDCIKAETAQLPELGYKFKDWKALLKEYRSAYSVILKADSIDPDQYVTTEDGLRVPYCAKDPELQQMLAECVKGSIGDLQISNQAWWDKKEIEMEKWAPLAEVAASWNMTVDGFIKLIADCEQDYHMLRTMAYIENSMSNVAKLASVSQKEVIICLDKWMDSGSSPTESFQLLLESINKKKVKKVEKRDVKMDTIPTVLEKKPMQHAKTKPPLPNEHVKPSSPPPVQVVNYNDFGIDRRKSTEKEIPYIIDGYRAHVRDYGCEFKYIRIPKRPPDRKMKKREKLAYRPPNVLSSNPFTGPKRNYLVVHKPTHFKENVQDEDNSAQDQDGEKKEEETKDIKVQDNEKEEGDTEERKKTKSKGKKNNRKRLENKNKDEDKNKDDSTMNKKVLPTNIVVSSLDARTNPVVVIPPKPESCDSTNSKDLTVNFNKRDGSKIKKKKVKKLLGFSPHQGEVFVFDPEESPSHGLHRQMTLGYARETGVLPKDIPEQELMREVETTNSPGDNEALINIFGAEPEECHDNQRTSTPDVDSIDQINEFLKKEFLKDLQGVKELKNAIKHDQVQQEFDETESNCFDPEGKMPSFHNNQQEFDETESNCFDPEGKMPSFHNNQDLTAGLKAILFGSPTSEHCGEESDCENSFLEHNVDQQKQDVDDEWPSLGKPAGHGHLAVQPLKKIERKSTSPALLMTVSNPQQKQTKHKKRRSNKKRHQVTDTIKQQQPQATKLIEFLPSEFQSKFSLNDEDKMSKREMKWSDLLAPNKDEPVFGKITCPPNSVRAIDLEADMLRVNDNFDGIQDSKHSDGINTKNEVKTAEGSSVPEYKDRYAFPQMQANSNSQGVQDLKSIASAVLSRNPPPGYVHQFGSSNPWINPTNEEKLRNSAQNACPTNIEQNLEPQCENALSSKHNDADNANAFVSSLKILSQNAFKCSKNNIDNNLDINFEEKIVNSKTFANPRGHEYYEQILDNEQEHVHVGKHTGESEMREVNGKTPLTDTSAGATVESTTEEHAQEQSDRRLEYHEESTHISPELQADKNSCDVSSTRSSYDYLRSDFSVGQPLDVSSNLNVYSTPFMLGGAVTPPPFYDETYQTNDKNIELQYDPAEILLSAPNEEFEYLQPDDVLYRQPGNEIEKPNMVCFPGFHEPDPLTQGICQQQRLVPEWLWPQRGAGHNAPRGRPRPSCFPRLNRHEDFQPVNQMQNAPPHLVSAWEECFRDSAVQRQDNGEPVMQVNNPTPGKPTGLLWVEKSVRWRNQLAKLAAMPPDKIIRIGNMMFCEEDDFIICKSSMISTVLIGLMEDGTEVAVKKMAIPASVNLAMQMESLMNVQLEHDYLIKYRGFAVQSEFSYIAMDLCDYTLDEYITELKKTGRFDPTTAQRLVWQLLKALQHMHENCKKLHTCLRPSKVLIDAYAKIQLSGFGLPALTVNKPSGAIKNTNSWIDNPMAWHPSECQGSVAVPLSYDHFTVKGDVQVAGMIVHFILSGGLHPFGINFLDIQMNIVRGWPKWKFIGHEGSDLIRWMLPANPDERMTISEALGHPFFWTTKRRAHFLVVMGGEIESERCARTMSFIHMNDRLNNVAFQAINKDWMSNIDGCVLADVRSFGVFNNTLADLLRLIYHCERKRHSLTPMSLDVLSGGDYFLRAFPSLFIAVYRVIRSSDWKKKTDISRFFQNN